MLATATIDRIADDLLHQARTSLFGFTDPSGVPVALVYRCKELARLPRGMQQEIVRRATKAFYRCPAGLLLMFLGMAALFALWLAGIGLFDSGLGLAWLIGGLVVLPSLLAMLPISLVVRPAVRRIAARVCASWPLAAESRTLAPSRLQTFSAPPD